MPERFGHRLLAAVAAVLCLATLLSPMAANATPTDPPTGLVASHPSDSDPFGTNPELSWDPVAGATHYRLQISTDGGFGTTLFNSTTFNTVFTPNTELPVGTLHWRVAAIDGSGTGPFSATASFDKVLAGPVPLTPVDEAVLSYPEKPPTFSWESVDSAKSYLLEIDDATDFISPIKVTTTNTLYTYTKTQEYGQPFFWRVRGASTSGGGGILTEWSETRSYEMSWGDPSAAPELVSPANTTVTAIRDLYFDWEPVLGAAEYEIDISISADFNTHYLTKTGLVGTAFVPPSTFLNGSYFWQVRAIDIGGHVGPWSTTFAFTRGWPGDEPGLDDGVPDLVYPSDESLVTDVPHFSWGPVELATHYEVQVDQNDAFETPANCFTLQTTVYPVSGGSGTPGGCSIFNSTNALDYGGDVYWRVRAHDDDSGVIGLWSDTWRFTRFIDTPAITGPADYADTSAPVLDWEPVLGAEKYHVYIFDFTGTLKDNAETYATSYSPLVALEEPDPPLPDPPTPSGNPYSWYVVAIDYTGSVGTVDDVSHFNLVDPVGTVSPDPIAPVSLAASVDMPSMQWQPVTDATSYTVQVQRIGSGVWSTLKSAIPYAAFTANTAAMWLEPEEYLWRVTAAREGMSSVTGMTGSFEILSLEDADYGAVGVNPPPCPNPPDPLTCDPVTSSPIFSWDTQYFAENTIYLAFDEFFTNIDRSYSTGWNTFIPREELPDNNVGQAYFWYVRACRPNHCTPHPQGVVVESAAFLKRSPKVVTISDNDGGVGGDDDSIDHLIEDEPLLIWEDYLTSLLADSDGNGEPDDLEAREYLVQVSTVPSFSNILDSETTDQTIYTPYDMTYPEGPLYWRVRAIDGSSNNLTWSDARPVTKASPLIEVTAPLDDPLTLGIDERDITGVPTFTWEPQEGAVEYVLEIYSDGDTNFSPGNRVLSVTTANTAFTPLDPLPLGDYAWRIRREDADKRDGPWTGQTPASTHTFSIVDLRSTLTLVDPPDQDPTDGIPITIVGNDIVFRWSTPVDVASYRFQRSTTVNFAAITENITTVMRAWAPIVKVADGTWFWRVQALNADGDVIGTSDPLTFTKVTQNPPGFPTGVTGIPGDGHVTVSWTAPASDGGSPITDYLVTASPGGASCAASGSPPPTTCVVAGLTNGTPYTFTVTAENIRGIGPASAPSAPVTPAGVPSAPTAVAGVGGNGQVEVSWTASVSDGGAPIASYAVTASPGGATCSSGSTSCVVSGLTNGTAYTFTVVATNAAGDSAPSVPSAPVTPRSVPGAPTDVFGVAGNAQVTVSWSAPAATGGSPITGYTVTAAPGGATCATAGALTCAVPGLTNGTPYTFTVVAGNAVGNSLPSATSDPVTPATVPSAPTGVSGVSGNAQVTVLWTASVSDGGSLITSYTATASPGGASCTVDGLSCAVTGLTNGTAYTFTVVATNTIGNSPPSAASGAVTPKAVPGAPTGVTGVGASEQVTVSWIAPASTGGSPITGYTVTATPGGATCSTGGALTCVVTGLSNGTAYTFKVVATNVVGNSVPSAASGPVTPGSVPGPPTSVSGSPGDGQVTVAWAAPAFTGGSAITKYTVTAAPGGLQCTTGGATTCIVTGLTNGTPYTFTVVATNATGPSGPSAPSIAITPSAATDCGLGEPGPFSDVSGTHPFCVDIEWLAAEGVTGGFPDGTFRPGSPVTRQSMAAFLYRYAGEPPFTPPASASFPDVPTSHPFFEEIEWLAASGVTGGFSDGTFRPGSPVTRQSMAAFLYRFAGEPAFTPPATASFPDVPTSHPFYKEIEWLAETDVTGGFPDGTFRPGSDVTRQAMAAFLHRYDELGI